MFLWWGPELIQIYNDAYRPSFGAEGRHPRALGMRGRECWTDIWEVIGPQIEQVMTTGEATWHEDQYLPIERNGRLEDVWWTYSYSPVRDEDGRIAATLVVCQETTKRVVGQRERDLLLEERRQAEESLRESEARLRAIYDGTYEYIGLLAADGTVLSANRASLEFASMRADDVMGRPFAETPWFVNTPGASDAIRDAVRRAAAGEFVRFETEMRRPSGECRTFDISLHPVRDEAGQRRAHRPRRTRRHRAAPGRSRPSRERGALPRAVRVARRRPVRRRDDLRRAQRAGRLPLHRGESGVHAPDGARQSVRQAAQRARSRFR